MAVSCEISWADRCLFSLSSWLSTKSSTATRWTRSAAACTRLADSLQQTLDASKFPTLVGQFNQQPSCTLLLWQIDIFNQNRKFLRNFQLLVVPRHQLSSYGRRAFCVAGPSVWNSLPDSFRNPIIGGNSFRQSLKTFPFATYWCIQRIRGSTTMRYINRLFTYLLTSMILIFTDI